MDGDLTGGDPVHPGVYSRLDLLEDGARCGAPDAKFFEPLPGRHLVAFGEPPGDDALRQLGAVARVRWLYRQLGLAEVDADDGAAVAALPAVAGLAPAWSTVGSTRGVAVGLNAICAFAANQAGDPDALYRHHPGIGYPIIATRDGRKELDLDPALELPTPPALVPVVNMSLGTTTVEFPTAMNDIVNLATGAASGEVLVVVAAGNCGARPGDSMSAWARPDWVLSVGATEDAEGTRIASYSSRGDAGPDLVALGESELNPAKKGTSFAAPRVTYLARLIVAAFCELGREVMVAQGQAPMGVPAIGYGIIDDFGDEIWWEHESATAFQALPLLGVHADVVAELVELTESALTVRGTPALIREVLLSAARPVPGAATTEAGAGFVDSDIVIERVSAITGADLWTWFGTGAPPDAARLAELRPFDAAGLDDLASIVGKTGPTVKFDPKTGRWVVLPQPNEQMREQSPRGWPVDLTGIRL